MTSYKTISTSLHPVGVILVTINRAKSLNSLNTETMSELKIELERISKDPTVRVVVLTGEGDKAFIAGADILEMKDKTSSEAVWFSRLGHDVAKLLETMGKPTIAAVNGFALGGGTEMALACDFIIASDKAVFGQPEVGLGVVPGFGGTFRLARFVGWAKAKELIFSGKKIKADEALALRLVNHVFPQKDFLSSTLELAKDISLNSFSAIKKCKSLMNEFMEGSSITYKIDVESQTFGASFGSPDQKEGMNAFQDKRKPAFEGLNP